jgi:hypothetical protein
MGPTKNLQIPMSVDIWFSTIMTAQHRISRTKFWGLQSQFNRSLQSLRARVNLYTSGSTHYRAVNVKHVECLGLLWGGPTELKWAVCPEIERFRRNDSQR